jgi:hypothetical protein
MNNANMNDEKDPTPDGRVYVYYGRPFSVKT